MYAIRSYYAEAQAETGGELEVVTDGQGVEEAGQVATVSSGFLRGIPVVVDGEGGGQDGVETEGQVSFVGVSYNFV